MSFSIRPRATTAAARQALLGLGLPSAHNAIHNANAAGLRPVSLCVGERKFSPSHNLAIPTQCERSISLRAPRHELLESGFIAPPTTPMGYHRTTSSSSSRIASGIFVKSPDLRFPSGSYHIKSPRFKVQSAHFGRASSGGRSPVLEAARSRGLGIGSPSFNSKSPSLALRSPVLGPEPSKTLPNTAPSLVYPSIPRPKAKHALGSPATRTCASPSLRSPLLRPASVDPPPRLESELLVAPTIRYPKSPTFKRLQEQHSAWEDEGPLHKVLRDRAGLVASANGRLAHKENATTFVPPRKIHLSTTLASEGAIKPTVVIHPAVAAAEMICMTSQECHILEAELPTAGKAGTADYCVSAYVRNRHGFKVIADSSRMVNGHHEWLIQFPVDVDMGSVKVSMGGIILASEMPLPDERPRQSVANLIGKFERVKKTPGEGEGFSPPGAGIALPTHQANADVPNWRKSLRPISQGSPPKAADMEALASPKAEDPVPAPMAPPIIRIPTPPTPAPEQEFAEPEAIQEPADTPPSPTKAASATKSKSPPPPSRSSTLSKPTAASAGKVLSGRPVTTGRIPATPLRAQHTGGSIAPLRPQYTGQSTTSTTSRAAAATPKPKVSTAAPARPKTPSSRPKTPSAPTPLHAPTASSIAKARGGSAASPPKRTGPTTANPAKTTLSVKATPASAKARSTTPTKTNADTSHRKPTVPITTGKELPGYMRPKEKQQAVPVITKPKPSASKPRLGLAAAGMKKTPGNKGAVAGKLKPVGPPVEKKVGEGEAGDDHSNAGDEHSNVGDDHSNAGEGHSNLGDEHSNVDSHSQLGDEHSNVEDEREVAHAVDEEGHDAEHDDEVEAADHHEDEEAVVSAEEHDTLEAPESAPGASRSPSPSVIKADPEASIPDEE